MYNTGYFLLVLSQFKAFTHFLSRFNKCRKLRVFCVNFLPWNLRLCNFFWQISSLVDWIRKFEQCCYRLCQIILLKILLCYYYGSICSMQWLIKCTVPGSRGFNLKQYWTQESNVPQSKIGRDGSTKKSRNNPYKKLRILLKQDTALLSNVSQLVR